jgi:long-subunit acyl-CoA synthetase (AMP-forming)
MPLDHVGTKMTTDYQSPVAMLAHWEKTTPNAIFLRQPINGVIKNYTWHDVSNQARRVAARLEEMALPPGSRICIFSKNCAQWFIADLGIMLAGHVSVPIFPTAGKETVSYVLEHADVKLVFAGKFDAPEQSVSYLPNNIPVVNFGYHEFTATHQWTDYLDIAPITEWPERAPDEMMTIIYTSGSTGQPKGVVHNYGTITWAASGCLGDLGVSADDRVMSYLPLAHITERVIIELASYYSGMQISFVESLDSFTRDVQNQRPTLFVSVPRLWTKFQMGVLAKMPQKKLDILLKIPLLNNLIRKKITSALGIDQARLWASGSAPLAPATIRWFARLGVQISEGWGMTENAAYGTAHVPFRTDKIGTIGNAYTGVDIRISDEGEIQVKSPCNMVGYYLEPEKTAETFTADGYLRTGDKGEIDAEGYVRITGRLKEIFKTSKGKYVVPAPIEAKILENTSVEQVCVTGSNLPQPIALLVLSEEAKTHSQRELKASLEHTLSKVNDQLESHMKVDHIVVLDEEWSIENELLTPTLKVKRHVLEARFADLIEADHAHKVVFA